MPDPTTMDDSVLGFPPPTPLAAGTAPSRPPDTKPRPDWSRKRWLGLVAAVCAALLGLALLLNRTLFAPETPSSTELVAVTSSTQTVTVGLSGTIAPQEQANASFAVPGTVQSVSVQVGDRVDQGQGLASINDVDLANAVALAEAQARAADAQLDTIRGTDGVTSAQLAAARAQVDAARAGVDNARSRQLDAILAAPLAGVVAEVNVKVGDQVTGAAAMTGSSGAGLSGVIPGLGELSGGGSTQTGAHVVIVVPDAWQMEASVGTADLPSLQPGQAAVVTPTGTTDRVTGEVDTVGIVAKATSGSAATFPVTIRLNATDRPLFSGSTADAVVTTQTIPDVLTLPVKAVNTQDGSSTVRKVVDGTPTQISVTVGRRFGDRLEITAGLNAGDEVETPKSVIVAAPPVFGPYGPSSAAPSPRETP